jgi:hypothetical protein
VRVIDGVEEPEESRRPTVEVIEVAVDMGADPAENISRRRAEEKEGYFGVGIKGVLGRVEETLPLYFQMGNIMPGTSIEAKGEPDEINEVTAAGDW